MTNKDAIVRQVRAALESEPRINLHHHPLKVGVVDGAVMLEGDAESIAAKRLALQIAAAVPQTSGVVDRVRIAVGERRGDGTMRNALCEFMLREPELRTCTIRVRTKGRVETIHDVAADRSGEIEVSVDDGVIALEGAVISLSHKRLAGVLAWWTAGCRDVVNALTVVPPEDDNDAEIVDALRIVLEVDPMLDSDQISARCRHCVVTLEGFVRTAEERRRAELDTWALFGVENVINHIGVGALA